MSKRSIFHQLLKSLAVLAALAVFALAALLVTLWAAHKTTVTLPDPTGPLLVGRITYAWTNPAARDELAPQPGAPREVTAWIWYPAQPEKAAALAEYLPAPWRSALSQYSGVLLNTFFSRDLSLVHAHSVSDADVSNAQLSYPVVIMRAGLGALTTDYTTLAEDLASHGYIVVGFDAPYRTVVFVTHDSRVIVRPLAANPETMPPSQARGFVEKLLPMWVDDANFVVSQLQRLNAGDPSGRFTGRLDMHRLGMFGHSFGGAQSLQFCHEFAACRACIDIDGIPLGSVVQSGLTQPTMIMLSDHSRDASDPEAARIRADLQSVYDSLPNGRLFITIRGANHFSFTDQMLTKNPALIAIMRRAGIVRLGSRRALAITAQYVHTFFDVYLRAAPPALLDNLASQYPEVEIQHTR